VILSGEELELRKWWVPPTRIMGDTDDAIEAGVLAPDVCVVGEALGVKPSTDDGVPTGTCGYARCSADWEAGDNAGCDGRRWWCGGPPWPPPPAERQCGCMLGEDGSCGLLWSR
jgi:hypothetical protein